jgi:PAS domain S-box-containing protein
VSDAAPQGSRPAGPPTEDVDRLLSGEIPRPPPPFGRRRRGVLALALAGLVALVAALAAAVLIDRHRALLQGVAERSELLAAGRVTLAQERLDQLAALPAYVVDSDAFRLFATELQLAAEEDPLAAQLHEIAPYVEETLSELVRQQALVAAYLISGEGVPLLASGAAPELPPEARAPAAGVFATAEPVFRPVVRRAGRAVMDIFLPVRAVQSEDPGRPPAPVAVFLMTVPVGDLLVDLVTPPALALPGERILLVQDTGAGHEAVMTGAADRFRPVDWPGMGDSAPVAGTLRAGDSPFDEQRVFSLALPVERLPWLLVEERDHAAAMRPLRRAQMVVLLISGLFLLTVLTVGVALLSTQASGFNRTLALQYREQAARIEAHRRLLDSINETIQEMIGLKRRDGTYAYVNAAFARAVGRTPEQVVGQPDAAVFGPGQAQWLEKTDREATESGRAIRGEERLYLDGRQHFLEVSKVPLTGGGGTVEGIVSVARDVTELVEERQRREAALNSTIDALVKTIEFTDPYLAGHSHLVGGVAGLIARQLGLPETDRQTLEIAARLAQIGKLFVPREIVAKPERLTAEEQAVMERHIDYAAALLVDIDFAMPVPETIAHMYERLDGSGYPAGLSGEAVPLLSRVLGLADVFAARVRPRSYRGALPPDGALDILRTYSVDKFGAPLIEALAAALASTEGEKLMAAARAGRTAVADGETGQKR